MMRQKFRWVLLAIGVLGTLSLMGHAPVAADDNRLAESNDGTRSVDAPSEGDGTSARRRGLFSRRRPFQRLFTRDNNRQPARQATAAPPPPRMQIEVGPIQHYNSRGEPIESPTPILDEVLTVVIREAIVRPAAIAARPYVEAGIERLMDQILDDVFADFRLRPFRYRGRWRR